MYNITSFSRSHEEILCAYRIFELEYWYAHYSFPLLLAFCLISCRLQLPMGRTNESDLECF